MRPRLHLVSLPHTTLTEKHLTCAYTQKLVKFAKMMLALGYEVYLYGADECDTPSTEHIVVTTQQDRKRWGFGDGFDTAQTPFLWDANVIYWKQMNSRVIRELKKRVNYDSPQDDMILLIAGWAQQPIAAGLPEFMAVEWGVGYEGIFTRHCAFESYAWMHHVYGLQKTVNGRAYDAVIPNFFDPADFIHPSSFRGAPKADYLLYIGRLIHRKGPHVAAEIARRVGMPLVVAGPGDIRREDGRWLIREAGADVELVGEIEYVGEIGRADRARLMGRATATIVPTLYIEPFGGVAVESMMAGTPVIASDWGSFTEIVEPGLTGERFRTLREGAEAVEAVKHYNPLLVRGWAEGRFGLEAVGQQFDHWFLSLQTLWGEGWYA